jgi:pilus assembly protein Flp/PilA
MRPDVSGFALRVRLFPPNGRGYGADRRCVETPLHICAAGCEELRKANLKMAWNKLRHLLTDKGQEGATLAEYGLLLALIAVVCLAAISLLGTQISSMFNTLAGSV